jgi:hypothetical protein
MNRGNQSASEASRRQTVTVFGDDRGASNVIGFVLAFAITTSTFAIYQGDVVPHQVQATEFEHSQSVETDMERLQRALRRSGVDGAPRSATVRVAASYKPRAFGMNPPESVGRLEAGPPRQVEVTGFKRENPGSGAYWDGSTRTFDTRLLSLGLDYTRMRTAPSYHLEHGMVTKEFHNGKTDLRSGGGFITSGAVNLQLLESDLSRTSPTASLDVHPVSEADDHTTLETESGGGTIELPTTLSETEWENYADDRAHVSVSSYDDASDPHRVTLSFDGGRMYDLRISRLSLGEEQPAPTAHHVAAVSKRTQHLDPDTNYQFTVEVRDEYGNPVDDTTVSLSVQSGSGTLVQGSSVTTGADGVAQFTYTTGSSPPDPTVVRAGIDDESPNYEYTEFELSTSGAGAGAGAGSGNPVYTVSTPNQQYTGLNDVDTLYLNDGSAVSTGDCLLSVCSGGRSIAADLTLDGSTEQYRVQVQLYDDTNDDGAPEKGRTKVVRYSDDEVVFEGDLTESAVDAITDDDASTRTDVFDENAYDFGGLSLTDPSDDTFDQTIQDATMMTNAVQGRVDVDEEPDD